MAGLGIAGGLGQVGNSFIEGMNGARDRQYLEGQRARAVEEQQRADAERKGLQGIQTSEDFEIDNPDYVENPVLKDDEGNDMPGVEAKPRTITGTRKRSAAAIARDTADVYKQSGNIEKYTANAERAQKLTMDDANRQATALMANADSMPLMDYAKAAANIFSSDSLPFSIKGVSPDPAGTDGVMLTVQNDQTGVQKSVTFKDHATLNRALQSMYQPETYNKIQTTRAEAAARVAEEIAKNPYQTVAPGATAIDKRTGKAVYNNPTDRSVIGTDTEGNPIYGKPGGGSGTGAGSGSGKAGKGGVGDPVSAALTHFDSVAQHSEDKLPIDQSAQARDYVSRLATTNPTMPAAMVSRVAIAAAKDPSKLVPAINPDTGLIDTVFDDGQNGKISFNQGIGSALKPGSIKPEQLQQMTKTLLDSKSPQEKADLIAAANDGKARAALESKMRQQAAEVIAQRTQGLTEQQAQVVTQQVNQALQTKLGYLGNNLDMIHSYGEKPAPAKKTPSAAIKQPGGMGYNVTDPNSQAGRSQAKQAQLKAENAAKEQEKLVAQQALSKQFQADKASMQPLELAQKYGDMRFQLPTADAAELQQIERQIR